MMEEESPALVALRARALAGDAAAMYELATTYYGRVVELHACLDCVGPWTLAAAPAPLQAPLLQAAAMQPPMGAEPPSKGVRSQGLALLWLSRAAKAGHGAALWNSVVFIRKAKAEADRQEDKRAASAALSLQVPKLRAYAEQHGQELMADADGRRLYGQICWTLVEEDYFSEIAVETWGERAAESGSIALQIKYADICQRRLAVWAPRAQRALVAAAENVIARVLAGGASADTVDDVDKDNDAKYCIFARVPEAADDDRQLLDHGRTIARFLKDKVARELDRTGDPAGAQACTELAARLLAVCDGAVKPVPVAPAIAAWIQQGRGPDMAETWRTLAAAATAPTQTTWAAVDELIHAMALLEMHLNVSSAWYQFATGLAEFCAAWPADAEGSYRLAICCECDAVCAALERDRIARQQAHPSASGAQGAADLPAPFGMYAKQLRASWSLLCQLTPYDYCDVPETAQTDGAANLTLQRWSALSAEPLLDRAAAGGHRRAMRALAHFIVSTKPERAPEAVRLLEALGSGDDSGSGGNVADESAAAALAAAGQLLDAGVVPSLRADPNAACRLWTRAALLPDAPAVVFLSLGLAHHSGDGVPAVDRAAARAYYERAAALGSRVAMCILGRLCEWEPPAAPDWHAAFRWYRMACYGPPPGQWFEVNFYVFQHAQLLVYRKAGFFRDEEDTNWKESGLGPMYRDKHVRSTTGILRLDARYYAAFRAWPSRSALEMLNADVDVSDKSVFGWPSNAVVKAAAAGHPLAAKTVLAWVDSGRAPRLPVTPEQVATWRSQLERAGLLPPPPMPVPADSVDLAEVVASASRCDIDALCELACRYETGTGGLPQDLDRCEAIRLRLVTDDPGVAEQLAEAYTTGTALHRDPDTALLVNCLGVAQDSSYSLCQVGHALEYGDGVERSVGAALAIYRTLLVANRGGVANATANLARLHLLGAPGVPKNVQQALRLYKIAATRLGNDYDWEDDDVSDDKRGDRNDEGGGDDDNDDDESEDNNDMGADDDDESGDDSNDKNDMGGDEGGGDKERSSQGDSAMRAISAVVEALETGSGVLPDAAHVALLRELAAQDSVAMAENARRQEWTSATLPAEIMQRILSFLPLCDLVACRAVCAVWRTHVRSLEARDAVHTFPCKPVFDVPPPEEHDPYERRSRPRAVRTVPCTCGAVLDAATAAARACLHVASPTRAHARTAPSGYSARLHAGRLPPARWETLAAQRALAMQLAGIVSPIRPFYLVGGVLPRLVTRAAARSRASFGADVDGQWSGGHVVLPGNLPVPTSESDMPSFLRNVIFGTDSDATVCFAWPNRFGPAQLATTVLGFMTGRVLLNRQDADPVRLRPYLDRLLDTSGPSADLADPQHAAAAAGAGAAAADGVAATPDHPPMSGGFARLTSRLDAVSEAWAGIPGGGGGGPQRTNQQQPLDAVAARLGIDVSQFQTGGGGRRRRNNRRHVDLAATHAGQGSYGHALAAFAATHLHLATAVECVGAPVDTILIGGLTKQWGRRCLVFAISPLFRLQDQSDSED